MTPLDLPNVTVNTLPAAAKQIGDLLARRAEFILWFHGEMGAGKTTLCGHILHALGLPPAEIVSSPTFSYMNEYQIGEKWYAHLDLYRLSPLFKIEELGLDAKTYDGIFVEWPDRANCKDVLIATHHLNIKIISEGVRHLSLKTIRKNY